jgi:hypothetical protein
MRVKLPDSLERRHSRCGSSCVYLVDLVSLGQLVDGPHDLVYVVRLVDELDQVVLEQQLDGEDAGAG